MSEYAINATLFISAPDERVADAMVDLIATRLSEPYVDDLLDEHGDPVPICVTLRLEGRPQEMRPTVTRKRSTGVSWHKRVRPEDLPT